MCVCLWLFLKFDFIAPNGFYWIRRTFSQLKNSFHGKKVFIEGWKKSNSAHFACSRLEQPFKSFLFTCVKLGRIFRTQFLHCFFFHLPSSRRVSLFCIDSTFFTFAWSKQKSKLSRLVIWIVQIKSFRQSLIGLATTS